MSKAEVTFMTEELVKELALRLMDERGMTMKQALDILETEILTGKIG